MAAETLSAQTLQSLQDDFVTYLRGTGKSIATIRVYRWGIDSLCNHLRDNDSLLNRESIEAWKRSLSDLNASSVALAATGVRQLLQWAADNDLIDFRLLRLAPRVPYPKKPPPRTLTSRAMLKVEYHLHTAAEENPDDLRALRDRALYFFIKSTAGRVSEILQVRRKNFKSQVVRERGGGPKELVAPPGVAHLVQQYLSKRSDDNDYLWIGWYGDNYKQPHRLTDEGVLRVWKKVARMAGVPPFRTLDIRHTAATQLMERQHDPSMVMELLGNRDFRSFQRYKEVVDDKLARLRADLDVGY
jgi:site-specific recombinase XerD